jgi:hypothetical protein
MLATDQFLESHGISTVFDQDVQFGNTFMGANTTFPDGSVINIPPRSLDLDFLAASDAVIGFLTTSVLTSDLLYVGTEQAKLIQTTNLAANSVTSNNLAGNNLGALKAVLGDVSGGTIAGVTITGGTIQTALSGPRTVLTASGFTVYGTGVGNPPVLDFNTTTGVLYVSGDIHANAATSDIPASALSGQITDPLLFSDNLIDSRIIAADIVATDILMANSVNSSLLSVTMGGANFLAQANPSFEDPTLSTWSATSFTYSQRNATDAKYGANYLRCLPTISSGNCTIAQTGFQVPVQPLRPYTISTWYRLNATRNLALGVACYNSSGTYLGDTWQAWQLTPIANNWLRLYWKFDTNALPAGTVKVSFRLMVAVSSSGDVLDLDGIQLEEGDVLTQFSLYGIDQSNSTMIAPGAIGTGHLQSNSVQTQHLAVVAGGANLFPNAGFELGAGDCSSSGLFSLTAVTSPVRNGRGKSVQIQSAGGQVWMDRTTYPTANLNKKYTATAWVRANSVARGAQIRIMAYASDGVTYLGAPAEGEFGPQLTAPVGDWIRVRHTVTAPNSSLCRLRVLVYFNGTGSAEYFYIDEMQLEEGDVPTAWNQYIDPTIIDGGTITTGIVRTAIPGGGTHALVLDGPFNALRSFDPGGAETLRLDGANGLTIAPPDTADIGINVRYAFTWEETFGNNVISWVEGRRWQTGTTIVSRKRTMEIGVQGSPSIDQAYTRLAAYSSSSKPVGLVQAERDAQLASYVTINAWGNDLADSTSPMAQIFLSGASTSFTNDAKVQVTAQSNSSNVFTRTLIDSVGNSSYFQTGSSFQIKNQSIPVANSTPVDPANNAVANAAYLYLLEATSTGGGTAAYVYLVRYNPGGGANIFLIANLAFTTGDALITVSAGEFRLRVQTPAGTGTSTWNGTRVKVS